MILPIGRPRRSLFWHIFFFSLVGPIPFETVYSRFPCMLHTQKNIHFQEKYTKHSVLYELKFISFYFMRSKKTTMLTTAEWNPFIHTSIDYNVLCCSFNFDFHLCVFYTRFVAVLNFSSFSFHIMHTIRATIVQKCFSKQIENKLKNSLCTFSNLFHSRFLIRFQFHKTAKIKWLSCRIREWCSVLGVFSNSVSSGILKGQNREQIFSKMSKKNEISRMRHLSALCS